jgi:hypothetical protein
MGAFILGLVETLFIELIRHVEQSTTFWAAIDKAAKAIFELIVAAGHPNTVLVQVAKTGLTLLAEADSAAVRADNVDPSVGG